MVPGLPGRTILLVEDNPGDARLIAEAMRGAGGGVRFESVETLAAALAVVASTPVDAVILDLGLPDSTGMETFTKLRDAAPSIATIIMSGMSDDRVALEAVQKGAQDFLVKGHVDGDSLLRSIGYAIERKRSEEALRETEEQLRHNLEVSESVAGLSRALVAEQKSIAEVARLVLDHALALTGSLHGLVTLLDPDGGDHATLAATGLLEAGLPLEPDHGRMTGAALASAEPFFTNDPAADGIRMAPPAGHDEICCLLSVPAVTISGISGQITVANAPRGYTARDVDAVERLAAVYAVAIVQNAEHATLLRSEADLRASNEHLEAMIVDVAAVMGGIIEARDPYTQGHQVRVAAIAESIASEMGLDDDEVACVRMAGLLHDIGKLSVPSEILSKPGQLSDVEIALIREHPARGHDILSKIAFPWPIADIVRQHHERCDGSGYPAGLRKDETLLPARILSVADVLEAMSSFRPYRAALGAEAALYEVVTHPTLYCASVVGAAVALHERGLLGI